MSSQQGTPEQCFQESLVLLQVSFDSKPDRRAVCTGGGFFFKAPMWKPAEHSLQVGVLFSLLYYRPDLS